MGHLVLLGLIMLAATAAWRWVRKTPLARLSPATQSWIWLLLLVLIVLALTGRLGALIPVIGAAVAGLIALLTRLLPTLAPLLLQYLNRRPRRDSRTGVDSGAGVSRVESKFLSMQLDHATGQITGEILEGAHAGSRLADLDLHQLNELYRRYLRSDPESAKLLEAYLERHHGGQWRTNADREESEERASGPGLTRDEAYEILGLRPGASRDEIVAAHRRLIQKLHPDRGGSDYLAAKINQAKRHLLGA